MLKGQFEHPLSTLDEDESRQSKPQHNKFWQNECCDQSSYDNAVKIPEHKEAIQKHT